MSAEGASETGVESPEDVMTLAISLLRGGKAEEALSVLEASSKAMSSRPSEERPVEEEGIETPTMLKTDISKIPLAGLQKVAEALVEDGERGAMKALKASYKHYVVDPAMMSNKDIWVQKIFPFLGPGYFVYVAGVCHQFKQNYLEYFSKIEQPPMIGNLPNKRYGDEFQAPPTSTFYSVAFSNVPCAAYWDKITEISKGKVHLGGRGENCTITRREGVDVANTIAKHGNPQVLQWAYFLGFELPVDTWVIAAKFGRVEVLQWGLDNVYDWRDEVWICGFLLRGGHLDGLKYAVEKGCPWDPEHCLISAARSGRTDIAQWALQSSRLPGKELDRHVYQKAWMCATEFGHLKLLKWADENGFDWRDKNVCLLAAMGGHFELLQFALEKGCPWTAAACHNIATRRGHTEVAEWLQQNMERFAHLNVGNN